MLNTTYKVSKSVPALIGKDKIKRKGNLVLAVPESLEDATALFGANLWKWAVQGYRQHQKVAASNSLIASIGDRALMRAFNEAKRTLVEIMEMSEDQTIEVLKTKAQFQPIFAAFDAAKSGDSSVTLDYTTSKFDGSEPKGSLPNWFEGGSDDEDTEEDE